MQIARACALLISLPFLACGDDGGTKLIDSGIGNTDAGPKVCTSVATIGGTEMDVSDESAGRYLSFYADIGEIDGDPAYLYFNFRHNMANPTIPATVDVATGTNNDYFTCTTCFSALTFDADTFEVKKRFFQQAGTVNFTGGDPVTMRHLMASLSNLKLQEIDFDDAGDMMYIPTGPCITLNASIEQDNVPNDWTCDVADYYSSTTGTPNACQCDCGAYDGDCYNPANATPFCTGATTSCWPVVDMTNGTEIPTCVARPMNDTCATAEAITIGTTGVSATLVGAGRHYSNGLNGMGCTGYAQIGPDVVYKVTLAAGTAYTVTLSGTDADLDGTIAIVGPSTDGSACAADPITTCIAGSDKTFAGQVETTTFTPAAAGQYFIIVDSFYRDDAGPFTLTITQ